MLYENEVLMFLLGLGVLIFLLSNRGQLKSIPSIKMLFLGFLALLLAWAFTILEGCFLKNLFNYLEHAFYALSAILVAIWSWKVFSGKEEIR
jgi:hypothetical protein